MTRCATIDSNGIWGSIVLRTTSWGSGAFFPTRQSRDDFRILRCYQHADVTAGDLSSVFDPPPQSQRPRMKTACDTNGLGNAVTQKRGRCRHAFLCEGKEAAYSLWGRPAFGSGGVTPHSPYSQLDPYTPPQVSP